MNQPTDSIFGTCRVMVVGAQRQRLVKVMSLVHEQLTENEATVEVVNEGQPAENVSIEYLACVPTFDSYEDEDGVRVRYLVRLDYYGPHATFNSPASLLPFFDADASQSQEQNKIIDEAEATFRFPGISGVAIGGGIDEEDDIAKIAAFIETMASSFEVKPIIESIRPNPEFSSMKEEMAAYRELTDEEKEKVAKSRTMGPAKMADFVRHFAGRIVSDALMMLPQETRSKQQQSTNVQVDEVNEVPEPESVHVNTSEGLTELIPRAQPKVDVTKPRYLCRKCRTVLFGEDDLQDPPHVPSKHNFSYRKQHHSQFNVSSISAKADVATCQSIFLQDGLAWMGNMDEFEGRFLCPKCQTKVGSWNWSGAQCSCGTWVVPAVQIPRSKVDEACEASRATDDSVNSSTLQSSLPPRAIISPAIRHLFQFSGASPHEK